ncbi:WD40-repeat-containing domain protein [Fusarium redolens]|uniref:WD40-repeat-containing domain protein n=1 Tax=Fusarium redolens TaxID=48865 RepID=A0A9P9FV19_FUSRE|nr:WD40-repeat-containing domain protein [Fusarium redolens]KAH7205796.1 WD40-repeat-containing domain protein [Fusarium redolens]
MTEPYTQGNLVIAQADIPGYIRIKHRNLRNSHFKTLFLAQELIGGSQPDHSLARSATQIAIGGKILNGGHATIWAADFSPSGRYLAVAGKDPSIKVFKVISTEEERMAEEGDENQAGPATKRFYAPVFLSTPIREYTGHTGEVLSLSWSKNDFILSCSTDKTVRLWHPSQPTCLRVFRHAKTVTSVAFHPIDDRFFLSGSFDAILRLWSIPTTSVAYSSSMTDVITAVAFSPDGKVAMAGSFHGTCIFLDTVGLKGNHRTCTWSPHAKVEIGVKITGIQTVLKPGSIDPNRRVKVMITTNDSRIRIYNLTDQTLTAEIEGLMNLSSQIRARFNEDGTYVVCGSEEDKVHIWHLGLDEPKLKHEHPHESFRTHSEVVTNALIAPAASREIVNASKDPIYDLCNPPAVALCDLQENTADGTSTSCSIFGETELTIAQLQKCRAYTERSRHPGGNVIVTTDTMGKVKVFRQDCAFSERCFVPGSYKI